MTLIMTSIVTYKMTSKVKLYTDKDLDFERVFEIKVLDFGRRDGIKQKSFSIFIKKGTKDKEYISTEDLKNFIEEKIKNI